MGYMTRYELIIVNESIETTLKVVKGLREISESAEYCLQESGYTEEETKWHNHEEDMQNISIKYPNILFKLHGEGEDNEDIWVKYFKNGLKQICSAIITFEEFDESKLS